jgi:hypothetical protein
MAGPNFANFTIPPRYGDAQVSRAHWQVRAAPQPAAASGGRSDMPIGSALSWGQGDLGMDRPPQAGGGGVTRRRPQVSEVMVEWQPSTS